MSCFICHAADVTLSAIMLPLRLLPPMPFSPRRRFDCFFDLRYALMLLPLPRRTPLPRHEPLSPMLAAFFAAYFAAAAMPADVFSR